MTFARIHRAVRTAACLAIGALVASVVAASPASAAYPGENGRIAYYSSPDIWTVKADGTDPVNVTKNVDFDAFSPAVSPNGRWIAFEGDNPKHLWATDTGGRRLYNLTKKWDDFIFSASHPTWSPNGKLIAFTAFEYDGSSWPQLFVMPVDGSRQPRKLTNLDTIYYPEWAPAGDDILFVEGTNIYLIDKDASALDPTAPRLLYDGGSINDPAWAPSGEEIVFDEEVFQKPNLLRVIDRQGNVKRDYTPPDPTSVVSEPAWSPDGQRIVFYTYDAAGEQQLATVDAQFAGAHQLITNYAGDKRTPDWGVVPPPDTTAPTVRITSGPAQGSTTTKRSATFTFASNEFGATFLCKLDALTRKPCQPTTRFSNLSARTHTLRVWAKDIAGNISKTPAVRSWTVKG